MDNIFLSFSIIHLPFGHVVQEIIDFLGVSFNDEEGAQKFFFKSKNRKHNLKELTEFFDRILLGELFRSLGEKFFSDFFESARRNRGNELSGLSAVKFQSAFDNCFSHSLNVCLGFYHSRANPRNRLFAEQF